MLKHTYSIIYVIAAKQTMLHTRLPLSPRQVFTEEFTEGRATHHPSHCNFPTISFRLLRVLNLLLTLLWPGKFPAQNIDGTVEMSLMKSELHAQKNPHLHSQ